MRMKRSQLEKIVREELLRHIHEQLSEAKPDDVKVTDAHDDKKGKEDRDARAGKGKKGAKTEPQDSTSNVAPGPGEEDAPPEAPKSSKGPRGDAPEQELAPEPADDELAQDDVAPDDGKPEDDGEAEADEPSDEAKSDISDELTGKTVQSITLEPKSKMMPGAVEVDITFKEVTDTFRILVTKTGQVKFYWRGLHNSL